MRNVLTSGRWWPAAVLVLACGAFVAAEDDKSSWGWTEPNPTLQVILLKPGASWDKNAAYNEQKGIQEHVKYLKGLTAKGQVVLGGPFTDNSGGLIVLRAKPEEAKKIAAEDPSVKAGLLSSEVRPWMIATGKPNWAPEAAAKPAADGEKSCGAGKGCGK